MSTHNRPARVAEELRQELSELLARGLKDPRVTGFLTVTGAKMSPDLKEAVAYVSIHAGEAERKRTMEGLQAASTYLQRELSRRIGLRFTPHLRFVYDESIERGDRIERLLREAKVADAQAAAARGEPPAAPAPPAAAPAEPDPAGKDGGR